MNPFSALYDHCNTGTNADKYADLPAFPRLIDVEPAGVCNFKCLCCPTGLRAVKRPVGFMAFATWQKIVDQCEPHGTALRMIGWGESLLHPDICRFVAYAADAGLLTHINSNASKLDGDMAAGLVKAGLSSIKFSFQGVDRVTYAEMRQTDFFEGMLDAIALMRAVRGDCPLPYIAASTSITYETPEMVEAFRVRLEPLVDHLSIGRTIFDFIDLKAVRIRPEQREILDRVRALETAEKVHPTPCPEVNDKLSIHWDGAARVCCNDWQGVSNLGNVNDRPIEKIWRHEVIEAYRKRLSLDNYSGDLCQSCYDYAGLTSGEPA